MSFKPNQNMQRAAKRALEYRKTLPPSKRFGTPVGLARARDIAAGKNLSVQTVKRMRSFLARHRKNYDMYKDKPVSERGAGYWSFGLWGGYSAIAWVESKLRGVK